eukprot:Hpha_TRINITY_DN15132_c0_g2::TRINITY_DN15132_c0_g2_i2::g.129245::m.129245
MLRKEEDTMITNNSFPIMQHIAHAAIERPRAASSERRPLASDPDLPKCRGYMLTEELGAGSYGKVYGARWGDGGQWRVALKIAHEQQQADLRTEEKMLLKVGESKWVVRYLGGGSSNDGLPFLALEMLGGSLQELLGSCESGQPLGIVRTVARQLLQALLFLEVKSIVHRDLKPNNVLFTLEPRPGEACSVKLIDFGMAMKADGKLGGRKVQTKGYRSPEVALGLEYGTAIDMWSVGCVVAEMVTGRNVWAYCEDFDALHSIHRSLEPIPDHMRSASPHHAFRERPLPQPEAEPSALPASSVNLHSMLKEMLRVDPKLRGTPKQLLNHEFVTGTDDDTVEIAALPAAGCEESDTAETTAETATPLKETPCTWDVASEQSDQSDPDPMINCLTPEGALPATNTQHAFAQAVQTV